MWQETELFIQQNVLLRDSTIRFIGHRLLCHHRRHKKWPLSKCNYLYFYFRGYQIRTSIGLPNALRFYPSTHQCPGGCTDSIYTLLTDHGIITIYYVLIPFEAIQYNSYGSKKFLIYVNMLVSYHLLLLIRVRS
jgi:hypothetical protein